MFFDVFVDALIMVSLMCVFPFLGKIYEKICELVVTLPLPQIVGEFLSVVIFIVGIATYVTLWIMWIRTVFGV